MRQMFIGLMVTVAVAVTVVAQGPARVKVMLLDGESGGPYHKWQLTTPLIKKALEETGKFDVTVVTAPAATGVLTDFRPDFAAYKAVVFNYDAPDDRWPEPLRASFEQYVSGGGGVVIVHAADNAFSGWKAWNDMIGVGGWRGRTVASGPYWYYKDDKLVKDPADGPGASHGRRTPYVDQDPRGRSPGHARPAGGVDAPGRRTLRAPARARHQHDHPRHRLRRSGQQRHRP